MSRNSSRTSVPLFAPGPKTQSLPVRLLSLSLPLLLLLLLVLGGGPYAAAQTITATIIGTVTDPTGAVVSGASAKATNINTGYSQVATSGNDGTYRIPGLQIGQYEVDFTAAGFETLRQRNIVLSVDQTFTLNISLTIGAQSQSITVSDAPPTVNLSTSQVGQTVSPVQITQLPLVNRSVYSQVSLVPGVQSNSASSLNSNTP